MRTGSVSSPCSSIHALNGASAGPKVRIVSIRQRIV
jgi:hypothetical protein